MNISSKPIFRAVPKTLTIEVTDENLIEELAQYDTVEKQEDFVEDMAEVGVRVKEHLRQDRQSTDMLRIMEQMKQAHKQQLEELRTEREAERKQQAQQLKYLNETVANMGEQLAVGTQTSREAVAAMRSETSELLHQVNKELLVAIRDSNQDAESLANIVESTLGAATADVKETMRSASLLLESYQERDEAQEGSSSRKGAKFEERMFNDLLDFADHRGDNVRQTGVYSEEGTNSKKGDLLYTLVTDRGPIKIALELKDKTIRRSGKEPFFLPDLRDAKDERGAKYGIVVGSLDENSKADGSPNFMPLKSLGDNNYAVLVDEEQSTPIALLAALQMIRNLESREQTHHLQTEQMAVVERRLQRISELTSRLRGLKSNVGNLKKNFNSLQETLELFESELKREVRGLERVLDKGY